MQTALPRAWRKLRRQRSRENGISRRIRRRATELLAVEPVVSAEVAGLRYVNDLKSPGIRRRGHHKRFRYVDPRGHAVSDPEVLRRIKSLVIPPAWTDVWICPNPLGHLQATGRDARGRKQYRYHPRWRQVRDEVKYGRLLAFAAALPKIRERTASDLDRSGLPREKILATVVKLLEKTLIRVGNEEYARDNNSYGLTTMRNGHAKVNGTTLRFEFRGKSGKAHSVDLQDARLARIVKACRDLPGYELFQYLDDDGQRKGIESSDVNDYLREICSESFTAKDFRTWAGTVLTACELSRFPPHQSQTVAKKNIVEAVKAVATRLGNTTSVCRKCYIHPAVFDAYMNGDIVTSSKRRAASRSRLSPQEAAVVALIRRWTGVAGGAGRTGRARNRVAA
jgi:DNA topoisomerase-1